MKIREKLGLLILLSPIIIMFLYAIYDGSLLALLSAIGIVLGVTATTVTGWILINKK